MRHASSWLGYSWDLADLVYHGIDGIGKDGVVGGGVEPGRVSRREKFRSSAGPTREEMQWLEILAILRKVSKLPVLLHSSQNVISDSGGSCTQVQPTFSAPFENWRETPASGVDFQSGGCSEQRLKHMLQEVLWPFDAVGDITSTYFIEIAWEDIPSSADPVLGGGYKTECTGETCRLKHSGREMKNNSEHNQLNDVIQEEAHFDLGDSLGRGGRKRWQVEKIASALKSFHLKPGATVVDFGCGSGALTLPLAAIFPEFNFVGVDFKLQCVILLEERARWGNLQNVTGVYGRIENYTGSFDACVALHACGIATDLALLQAMKNRAAYVMSPCCIGKLQIPIEWALKSTDSGVSFKKNPKPINGNKISDSITPTVVRERQQLPDGISASHSCIMSSTFPDRDGRISSGIIDFRGGGFDGHSTAIGNEWKTAGGPECENFSDSFVERWEGTVSSKLAYPRSSWLRNCITEKEFQVLARAADWSSYDFESLSSRLHSLCKVVLELDRNEASREVGFWTWLYTLSNKKAGTVGVSHVLVGKPQ